jgi:DNA-binding response OmpR family regulator
MIRADEDLNAALFVLMGEASGQNCDTASEAFRAGADDYYEKSCNRQFLAAKISRLVALRRTEAELRQRFRNLHRSELHLTKIIEDASNLVAVLDSPSKSKLVALGECDIPKSGSFFSKKIESKKQMPKKNADALEIWKRALQAKEFVETKKFGNEKREKVYYEIVC